MKSLLTPGIFLALFAVLLHTGIIPLSTSVIVFAFYCAVIGGLLLAWRFHSSRIFLAVIVVFLCQQALSYYGSFLAAAQAHGHPPPNAALSTIGILLPVNFVLLSLRQEKGFIFPAIAPMCGFLFLQSVFVAVVSRSDAPARAAHVPHPAMALPFPALVAFGAAAILLLARYLLFRKPAEAGLLWALAASLLALYFWGAWRLQTAYFAAAAFILAGAVVETSYALAYHDELTALPSRRALREALLRLEPPYTIAMVDIDHFKRCNDTYGHDIGDQVLRLAASRLSRIHGGGQAYRFGGEEFAIVFPGKVTADVLDYLEKVRSEIEASMLRVRGQDRRSEPRGPDRRNQSPQRRGRKAGHAIRELSQAPNSNEISVTISVGVAGSGAENSSPEDVIRAADKALYRAKGNGRNRIETALGTSRRGRGKTAGIA
jgi:GGDEF domain-containing protein